MASLHKQRKPIDPSSASIKQQKKKNQPQQKETSSRPPTLEEMEITPQNIKELGQTALQLEYVLYVHLLCSGHRRGRGLLCERRRSELPLPRRQNHLPLGALQLHVGGLRAQPERDEIPAGGTPVLPGGWGGGDTINQAATPHQASFRLRFQMQIYCYDTNVFPSLDDAVKGGGRIAAVAVFFEVGPAPLSFPPAGAFQNVWT